jgi:methionyl-tRNA synthetase
MSNKYFGGIVTDPGVCEDVDNELKNEALECVKNVDKLMEQFHVADSLDAILSLARRSNKYIDETMPWALAKDEATHDRLKTVLYNLTEAIRFIAVLLRPYLTITSDEILNQLGSPIDTYESLSEFGKIPDGHKVGEAKIIFSRIDAEKKLAEISEDIDKKYGKKEEKKIEGLAEIGIEDFAKVELRVAKILSAEPIKKAKKLLKLTLHDGNGERQVCSGIANYYKPEELIGKKVVLVANLKPVKLCGEDSYGMILAADCSENDVKVLFLDDSMPEGSLIR